MFDTILGWGFGAVALVAGLFTARIAGRLLPHDASGGRNVAIDGLRGYLAFGVFVHHGLIWYFHVRGGEWELPPPSAYRNLGVTCVGLFFMITGYLFIGKLLDARQRPVDWLLLFTSRVLRLTPLYLIAMAVLFAMVAVLSGGQLREPVFALLLHSAQWLGFSIFGMPDLNAVKSTALLIALVSWSLPYEWLFYLSLPLLAVVLKVKVPLVWLIGASLMFTLFLVNMPDAFFPSAFVKGAVAAYIARQSEIAKLLRRPVFAPVVLLAAWVAMFANQPIVASVLVAIAFCIIACGNTVFGLLSHRAAIVLGDVSYGVYLLHGLLLSFVFVFVLGTDAARTLSPVAHWAVVGAVGVAVVLVSTLSYRFVEWPAMRRVKRTVSWIRSPARIFAKESS